MSKKMLNILLLVGLLFSASVAFAQAPYPLRRNDDGLTTTGQPNNVPVWGGATQYGEVFVADKPGLTVCSAANTGTTAVTIIAATASVSHLVSRVMCNNNSTVASLLTLRNDVTTIAIDHISTTTLGTNKSVFDFPKPVKIAGAKTLNFIMGTNATSTICCANYLDVPNTTPTPTNTPTATPTP